MCYGYLSTSATKLLARQKRDKDCKSSCVVTAGIVNLKSGRGSCGHSHFAVDFAGHRFFVLSLGHHCHLGHGWGLLW